MSPYLIFGLTTAALSLGYLSKESVGIYSEPPALNGILAFETASNAYLIIWQLVLYAVVLRKILSFSRQEQLTIFRLREQYMKSKLEGKLNENSNEYRAKLQEMRDISQPKQIIYKIVLSEYISASLIPSLLSSLVLVCLAVLSSYFTDKELFIALKLVVLCYGIFNSTLYVLIRLNEHIRTNKSAFLVVVLVYTTASVLAWLYSTGKSLSDFYHLYLIVIWSCILLVSINKLCQLPHFYELRKSLFCSLR